MDPDALVSSTLATESDADVRSHRLVDGFLDHVEVPWAPYRARLKACNRLASACKVSQA